MEYRLFVDDLNWDVIREVSREGYTVKELNAKLFLPERDEVILDHLWETWRAVKEPRAILFCRTIEHAERLVEMLRAYVGAWSTATCLHSRQGKRERDVLLTDFKLGRIPIITAVDILNEGVDVPDVNIIGFLRVTHSRRIFVQQLGRGLRLREGKNMVSVLDFVTDIRRVAAIMDLRRSLAGGGSTVETLELPGGSTIQFTDAEVGRLMDAWIEDAADLETAMDEARLQFPDFEVRP